MCVSQNVTAHYVAPPIFEFLEYVSPPTTLCQYNISPKSYPNIPFFCGDTLFSALNYKMIDFYFVHRKPGRRSDGVQRYTIYNLQIRPPMPLFHFLVFNHLAFQSFPNIYRKFSFVPQFCIKNSYRNSKHDNRCAVGNKCWKRDSEEVFNVNIFY